MHAHHSLIACSSEEIEEDVFWMFACVVDTRMLDYFGNNMVGVIANSILLEQLVAVHLPEVNERLQGAIHSFTHSLTHSLGYH